MNILLICLDQLSAQALPAWGGGAAAPAIEGLAAAGTRFSEANTTCPLCMPARASFWTGLLPHQTGVTHNGAQVPELANNSQVDQATPTIGSLLSEQGYRCVHTGKTHAAGSLHGFDVLPEEHRSCLAPAWAPVNQDTFMDQTTVEKAEAFLADPGDQPWCLAVDVQNPHNICGWVGENADEDKRTPAPPGELPELPPNFAVDDWDTRPTSVRYMCCAHRRQAQAGSWTADDWRRYLAAYHYYVSLGDAVVGRVLNALDHHGLRDDTLIILWADHGDGIACHRQATKHTSFYQQTVRIPLIIAGPGIAAGNTIGTPVSVLDLLPTVADIGGAPTPSTCQGRSLLAAARGQDILEEVPIWSQWHTEWGFTIEPGRMLRIGRYKYCAFREDFENGHGEECYDLESDPWETRNLAADPSAAAIVADCRQRFLELLPTINDPFMQMEAVVDQRWRQHSSGYQHHRGPAAPSA